MTDPRSSCELCSAELSFAWTDHHGIAQCRACGAPYRLIHYDDQNKRYDATPTFLLTEDADRARQFHMETGAKLSAVGMGLSFPGSFAYDVARESDIQAWNSWAEDHPSEHQHSEPTDGYRPMQDPDRAREEAEDAKEREAEFCPIDQEPTDD